MAKTTNKMDHRKFSAHNKVAVCRCCQKQTHSSIDGCLGIELCRICYESSGQENAHSDSEHKSNEFPNDCPTCAGIDCLHEKMTK